MTAVPTPTALTWWMDLSVSVVKDSLEMAELAQVGHLHRIFGGVPAPCAPSPFLCPCKLFRVKKDMMYITILYNCSNLNDLKISWCKVDSQFSILISVKGHVLCSFP